MDVSRRSSRYRAHCVYSLYSATRVFRSLDAPTLAEFCYCALFAVQWVGFCNLLMWSLQFVNPSPGEKRETPGHLRFFLEELCILFIPVAYRVLERLSSSRLVRVFALAYVAKLFIWDTILPVFSKACRWAFHRYPRAMRIGLGVCITTLLATYFPETGFIITFTVVAFAIHANGLTCYLVGHLSSTNVAVLALALFLWIVCYPLPGILGFNWMSASHALHSSMQKVNMSPLLSCQVKDPEPRTDLAPLIIADMPNPS